MRKDNERKDNEILTKLARLNQHVATTNFHMTVIEKRLENILVELQKIYKSINEVVSKWVSKWGAEKWMNME